MGHSRSADGLYHIHGHTFEMLVGSRAQVLHGTAYKTSGGLTKADLLQNKNGRIVSKSKHNFEKRTKRLLRHGYGTKKGHFGYVRIGSHRSHRSHKRGGTTSVMNTANMNNLASGLKAMHHAKTATTNTATSTTGNASATKQGGNCGLMRGGYSPPLTPLTNVNDSGRINFVPQKWGPEARATNAAAGGGKRYRGGYSSPSASYAGVNSSYMIKGANGPGIISPEARATHAAAGGGRRRFRGGYSPPSASYANYGQRGGYSPPSGSYAGVNSPTMIKGVVPQVKGPLDMALGAGL
jgi:hypothetical protein